MKGSPVRVRASASHDFQGFPWVRFLPVRILRERGTNILRADVRAGVPDQVLSGSARLTRELPENVAVDVER
jgi:hypothetical protein